MRVISAGVERIRILDHGSIIWENRANLFMAEPSSIISITRHCHGIVSKKMIPDWPKRSGRVKSGANTAWRNTHEYHRHLLGYFPVRSIAERHYELLLSWFDRLNMPKARQRQMLHNERFDWKEQLKHHAWMFRNRLGYFVKYWNYARPVDA